VYGPLPPGGNPVAVSKYNIIYYYGIFGKVAVDFSSFYEWYHLDPLLESYMLS
jgi:hypothetical protein